MGNNFRINSIGFFIILAFQMFSVHLDLIWLNYILKPLLIMILGKMYLHFSIQKDKKYLGALFFCWLGDVLLMFSFSESFFIFGLGSFLIAHIFYIFTFRPFSQFSLFRSIPVVLSAGILYLGILYPHISGYMKWIIGLYVIIITSMSVFAIGIVPFNNKLALGSLLFMLSDSIIAIYKFIAPFSFSVFLIMTTYGLAQWLILWGKLKLEKQIQSSISV